MRSPLLLALLTAALLSGCVVEEPTTQGTDDAAPLPPAYSGDLAQAPPPADAQAQQQAVAAAPHGTPQWSNGTITTGTEPNQVPGAWARQDVQVANGFGDILLGELAAAIGAGSITLQVEDRADYQVRVALEARAATEQQAREVLARTRLEHGDQVRDGVLVLSDRVVTDPAQELPLPPSLIDLSLPEVQVRADVVIVLPLPPAIDADLGAASGAVAVSDLRGSRLAASTSSGGVSVQGCLLRELDASTSSGGVTVQDTTADTMELSTSSGGIHASRIVAGKVRASASSGGVELAGTIDGIEASTSSGGIAVDAVPANSGSYDLSTSSGGIEVQLPADGHAYKVTADVSSGDIDLDIPGAETSMSEDERHAEAETPGYEDAGLRTEVDADASSGGIEVTAR